jgi:hypothetical protein
MKPNEGYVEVTQEEFRAFLKAYEGGLEHHCTTICEPPSHGYYDFRKGEAEIGTMERQMQARQAYCVYDEGMGQGPAHFYVRRSGESA